MKTKIVRRRRKFAEKKRWNQAAESILSHCKEVFDLAYNFDTAVRDTVSEGLAFLVWSAFDCRAIALDFKDYESRNAFIDNSTAEWFRQRGFVEWFVAGAAALFHTTPPRRLAPTLHPAFKSQRLYEEREEK
jgi:hypothetical protein